MTVIGFQLVGWVERGDTQRMLPAVDGYRCAPPILRLLKDMKASFAEYGLADNLLNRIVIDKHPFKKCLHAFLVTIGSRRIKIGEQIKSGESFVYSHSRQRKALIFGLKLMPVIDGIPKGDVIYKPRIALPNNRSICCRSLKTFSPTVAFAKMGARDARYWLLKDRSSGR